MRFLGVIVALLTWLGPAHADYKDIAREAYREGTRQYDLGEFKAALDAFKKAYLNFEDPAFLYNIGQCQRQLGDKAEALRTYRVFLRKVPETPERAQVERIVAELQAAIDHDRAARSQPPTGTVEPSIVPAPPPARVPSPTTATATMSVPTAIIATATAAKKPLVKRGWFWGVVAGAAVVVAAGVTLGVVLGTESNKFVELTY
jgi:tetratricopeptide (TPR) repeat protein